MEVLPSLNPYDEKTEPEAKETIPWEVFPFPENLPISGRDSDLTADLTAEVMH